MDRLVTSAKMAATMAQERKNEIKLLHCTGDVVMGLADAAFTSGQSYIQARELLKQKRAELYSLRDEARLFTMLSCDILKPLFGRSYSEVWDQTGFKGSLASPLKPGQLMVLANALSRFFELRPDLELPTREVTSASAAALGERLKNAMFAVNKQEVETGNLKQQRDKNFAALRKCMRDMVNELAILLDPFDPRWMLFGFNRPGATQTPETPVKVKVQITDQKQANITWPAPARAEYFRVWVKVIGVDAEPKAIGSPSDPDFLWEELPVQNTVEIFVSAVNSGGESPLSEAVRITTP